MAKSSNKKSIEDLENQLLLKNKNLNEKYLEIETLLDLTNTINSLDDLESRHKQIGKIVKSRKKDDGNSEDIKEIKNLLKKINP